MHISSPLEKHWLQEKIEPLRNAEELTLDDKRRILHKLNEAESLSDFCIHASLVISVFPWKAVRVSYRCWM